MDTDNFTYENELEPDEFIGMCSVDQDGNALEPEEDWVLPDGSERRSPL